MMQIIWAAIIGGNRHRPKNRHIARLEPSNGLKERLFIWIHAVTELRTPVQFFGVAADIVVNPARCPLLRPVIEAASCGEEDVHTWRHR
jgi:hypothetical protein